mmetsp:Transcript_13345/g.28290  ORF Transcript_13345/g.28290 Transcript_13345/m.28290 type:complete len:220 (+) Transcript_13345:1037-1696(+)
MSSEVEDSIGLEDLFQESVVGSESVVRTGGLGEEKTHGISLVPERGLHSNENVSELLSVDNEVLPIRVEVSGGGSPVLFQVLGVRSELVVLIGIHAVRDVKLGRVDTGLGVVENRFHDGLLLGGSITDIISLGLKLLEYGLDRVEDIEVGGSSNIALVRGEGEDGDGNLLIGVLLGSQAGPLHGTVGEKVDTVGKGNATSGGTLTSSVDDGFDGSVDLG